MTNRQMFIGIAGVLLAVVGLAALLYPIHLDQFDVYGIRVNCGNGFTTQLTQATEPDGQFTAQCGSALRVRRAWAIPAVAIGWLLITSFLVSWVHNDHSRDEDAEPPHYVPHPEIAPHF